MAAVFLAAAVVVVVVVAGKAMDTHGIRALGFDWGGVIAGVSSTEFNKHLAGILNVSVDEYELAYLRHNDLASRGDMWRAVIDDLGSEPGLLDEILEYCDNKNDEPDYQMVSLLRKLKDSNMQLGLLTNASEHATVPRREQLEKFGLNQLFDVIDISYETGLRKPSLEAYEHFYHQFSDVKPEEMIFIDDVERNLAIPRRLGWQAVHFESPDQLSEIFGTGIEA